MSKKNAKAAPAKNTEVVVTRIKDLEAKHGLPGKTLRVIIRGLGFRAPATNRPEGTLGPTHLYEWSSDNEKHVKALTAIETAIENYKENEGTDGDE